MKKTILFLGAVVCGINFSNAQNCQELFISEYVEGWSNNKALEIYNPTANPINLSGYIVSRASNGSALSAVTEKYAVQLSGTIAPYSTYVGVVDLQDPNGTGQTAPVWDSLIARADGFYSPDYNTNSTFYWNGNDCVLLLKGTLTGNSAATLVSNSTISIVDIFGKIGEDPNSSVGNGWTSVSPYVGVGALVTVDHSLIRKHNVLKGVTDDAIAHFNPLGEYDSIPPVTYLIDPVSGDTIRNNDLSPKVFGNWFTLGTHTCDCAPVQGVKEIAANPSVSVYPNPSTGEFYLNGVSEFQTIEVLNSLGQQVEKMVGNSKSILSFSIENKGVYLVRLTSDSGAQTTKRVIIK